MIEEVSFQGYTCVKIVNGDGAELLVTVDRGPRIIAFQEPPESNLLAVLPGAGLDSPRGRFHFYRGHRLWVAPENPEVTYLPDEERCTVQSHPRRLNVAAPDNGCGLERSIDITGNGDTFVIDHRDHQCHRQAYRGRLVGNHPVPSRRSCHRPATVAEDA